MRPLPHRVASLALALAMPLPLASERCSNPAMSPEAECLEREHEKGGKTWAQAREACPIPE
jgi:hypothetical protein